MQYLVKKINPFYKKIVVFTIYFLLIVALFPIVNSSAFKNNSDLFSFSITFDLFVSIPVVYYLLVRKTTISNKSISVILTLNLIVAGYILPKQNQYYLDIFKNWFAPIIELFIIGFLIYNVRNIIDKSKKQNNKNADFFTVLKKVTSELVPSKISIALATEIAVFYYGFLNWKKRILKNNEFSYHKESGAITVLITFMFSGVIEIFVLHKLLLKWSSTAAWILTAISLYTVIQIYGILRSLPKRPFLIEKNGIYLRYGILSETYIFFKNIESIELFSKDIEKNDKIRNLSPFGKMEGHNIRIKLKEENVLYSLYGIKREYHTLLFFVDKKNEFTKQIKDILQHVHS